VYASTIHATKHNLFAQAPLRENKNKWLFLWCKQKLRIFKQIHNSCRKTKM